MPHNEDSGLSSQTLAGLTPLRVWDLAALVEKDWAERLAPYSLAPNDFRVLAVCMELERCTAVEIAARAPVDPSSISRIVHRLVLRDLLSRRRSQVDRRLVTLRLTKVGMELMEKLHHSLWDLHVLLTSDLSKKAKSSLESSIAKMLAAVNPSGEPR